jgi:FHS family L-fucose permease-like MFS transporter
MGLMSLVFFMWGALTCLNDLLVPNLKAQFHLNYTQVMLVQFCFFLTYALASMPASKLIYRIGYKLGIITGLCISAVGCGLFILAASFSVYALFLLGLFVLAAGIVVLQVAANPFVTLLGKVKYASSRLNFAQALNSLGTTLVPLILGGAIIGGSIAGSYLGIIAVLVAFIILVSFIKFPKQQQPTVDATQKTQAKFSLWQNPHVMLGAFAIFLYVGTEVSASSLVVNFLHMPSIGNLPKVVAAHYLSFFWGGALVGRFIGAWILRYINPANLVRNYALINAGLVLIGMFGHGHLAMWAILSLGLFNSVMFPTIFTLGLANTGNYKSQVSGILCTAIVGGAVVPELQGMLADKFGLQYSFGLLVITYLALAAYATWARKNT